MAVFSTMFFVQAALAVASIAYQSRAARKAKAAAKAAADARKGFEVPVEGESTLLPVCYGRSFSSGAQVFFRTKNGYTFQEPLAGGTVFDSNMSTSRGGSKNEYLYVQQAICQGEINKFIDWRIDDQKSDTPELQYGQRAHCYTKETTATDPMILANNSSRTNALFTGAANASMVFRLNRDEPQYNGIPQTSFYFEGIKVRDVLFSNGEYSVTESTAYSNNPALCLLDYLTNEKYGRGLSLDFIDLETFYKAKNVCNTIVRTNVNCNGIIWLKNNIATRNIPLYECNVVLPGNRSVRDNVISILATMGDAMLVWSNGKYKLKLQYPTSEQEIEVSATLTDDDILRKTIGIKYPSASERMNFCTITYYDEAEDFKEKTASWPKKNSQLYLTFLQEDNNVPLEKGFQEDGITDFYHAAAKAEELVRLSRTDVRYSFSVSMDNTILEPGDIILVNSNLNFVTNEYMKVQEVRINSDGSAEVSATKFDYRQLAWNVGDDQTVEALNVYDFSVEAPSSFSATTLNNPNSIINSVLLTWTAANDISVTDYVIDAGTEISGEVVYTTIAVLPSSVTSYVHSPNLLAGYFYRIRSRNRFGQYSASNVNTQAVVAQQALLGSVNLTVNPAVVSFVKQTGGATVPSSQTATIELQYNLETATYSSGTGNLPANSWRITSSLSGNLNTNGFYSTSITNNIATITVSPSQLETNRLEDTAITFTIKFNPTSEELAIDNVDLITFSRSLYLNEIKEGIQGVDGAPGLTNALIPVYIRSTSLPSTPTGGSISFGPFSITPPVGWSESIPVGSDPVYVSYGLASIEGSSGTDSDISWSVPALAFENGQDGTPATNFYEAFIYRRASSLPATPTGGSFNFGTRELIPPTNWFTVIPAYSENTQLYVSKYLFSSTDANATVNGGTWDVPAILAADGQDGSSGTSIYTFNLYIVSENQPATPTGGAYDFTNNIITVPTGGWSIAVPSNTASGGKVWVTSTTASIVGATGEDTSLTWTTPVVFVQNGINGVDGTNGTNGSRGPGWFRATSTTGSQSDLDNLTSIQITQLFTDYTGFLPVANDRFIISVPSTGAVKAWVFLAGFWSAQTQFVDGNLLVNGTVSGNALNIANGLFTIGTDGKINAVNSITVQDPVTGKAVIINSSGILIQSASSGGRMLLTQDYIKVFDENNVLRVQIGNLSV